MKCHNCEKEIQEGENEVLEDGETYCQMCFDELFFECADCHSTSPSQDATSVDGNLVCESCFDDHYFTCEDCNEIHHDDNACSNDNGNYVCESCFNDNYAECHSCGNIIHNDHSHYCEECDRTYCEECQCACSNNEYYSEQRVCLEPIKGTRKKKIGIDRLVGVEIEAENPSEWIDLPSHYGISEDGSLTDGVEVQTPPASLNKLEAIIKTATDTLKQAGCNISKNCGLHIHIETKDFTAKELMNFIKVYSTIEDLYFSLVAHSRRNNSYCKKMELEKNPLTIRLSTPEALERIWYEKKLYPCFEDEQIRKKKLDWNDTEAITKEKKIIKKSWKSRSKKFLANFKRDKWNDTRYTAINLHSHFYRGTIEFRHHQGTLNHIKIINWIDYNLSVLDYAKNKYNSKDLIELTATKDTPLLQLRTLAKIISLNKTTLNFFEKRIAQFQS